ncbi:MAG: hypothetical protein ACLR2E_01855 [Lachnospiraceae bacterium]
MNDFGINEMLEMQKALQEKYKDKWEGISPEIGKNKLLWMVGEIGEVIDVIKRMVIIRPVKKEQREVIWWRNWQMCSCIITMFCCVMELRRRN